MSTPANADALNELLAQSLGRGLPLSPADRARVNASFRATIKPGRPPKIIFPAVRGMDWDAIKSDAARLLVIVNDVIRAYDLCAEGQAAVAILGASRGWVRKWMQEQGVRIKDQRDMN